jgi:hypothetical protein
MKHIYEVFDEFEQAQSKKERMHIIGKNLSSTLVEILKYTFHPNYQWLIKGTPENFKVATDNIPGFNRSQLSTELRRIYLFQKGNAEAEKLSPDKREQLLYQLLDSIEPREAEVVIGIFQKDQGVKGLDYKFVKEAFPQLLP